MATIQRSGALLKLSGGIRLLGRAPYWPLNHRAGAVAVVATHRLELRNATAAHIPSSQRLLSTNSLPYILQPSFWKSLVPKFMKSKGEAPVTDVSKPKRKEWNPATFFIAIFMLIGSQAIQMIAMRRDFDKFSNQTEAKLASLREVVRRIQNGEDVDVESLLGTGNKQAERDWEDVIRELEEEDALYRQQRRKANKPGQRDGGAGPTTANDNNVQA